jgi:hypothetical protein
MRGSGLIPARFKKLLMRQQVSSCCWRTQTSYNYRSDNLLASSKTQCDLVHRRYLLVPDTVPQNPDGIAVGQEHYNHNNQ